MTRFKFQRMYVEDLIKNTGSLKESVPIHDYICTIEQDLQLFITIPNGNMFYVTYYNVLENKNISCFNVTR